ncbi:MAG: hypothetical protein V4641_18600 [Pseudomonadota bacterium]
MTLKPDVTFARINTVDHDIGTNVIAKRQGLVSRESAPGSEHSWLAIVHWRSITDADASMKSFSANPANAKLMALIAPGSMIMKRYTR